jgi:tRNA-specific 2-thiouridylase
MENNRKKVVVAMSGGVDSTLTARLLQEAGYDVYGATMQLFDGQNAGEEAAAMARWLHIPHTVIDLRKPFREKVISYFIDSYRKGITPNPCMVCDFHIKFGLFFEKAREAFGCDYFATGHYARILYNADKGVYEVHKGLDKGKDQSYMMYHLDQDHLAHIIFPLGRTEKKMTRHMAHERNIPVYNKAESQDICFLPHGTTYKDFLLKHAPDAFTPGDITDKKGHVLGHHDGLCRYTIGQRRGLGIASRAPLYVTGLDARKNRVIVGSNDDLFRKRLLCDRLDFNGLPAPGTSFRVEAKIRYGMKVHPALVEMDDKGRAVVTFDEPQRAVTPGQSVVFYDEDRLIGGGTILRPL